MAGRTGDASLYLLQTVDVIGQQHEHAQVTVSIRNPQNLGLQVLQESETKGTALGHHPHRFACILQQIHRPRSVKRGVRRPGEHTRMINSAYNHDKDPSLRLGLCYVPCTFAERRLQVYHSTCERVISRRTIPCSAKIPPPGYLLS